MGEMLLNGRLYGASGIRELTQAQYDALPASKLTDGILYCIKDTGIVEGDKYAPIIYSLEEREIGVWTDGKPLYEKTWILNYTAHTTAEHNTSIDIHALNVEVPIAINGFWRRWAGDGNKLYYHWGSEEPTYGQGWARVDSENGYTNGRIAISIKSDGTDYQQVTLQYTKTTDISGSGTWGTDGVPMVHYDGTEKVIGTWFGETLYEKIITGLNFTPTQASWSTVSGVNIPNLGQVILCGFGQADTSFNYVELAKADNNGNLIVWFSTATYTYTKVLIRYTKTS